MKLTNKEKKESLFLTWGRIRTKLGYSQVADWQEDERLKALIDKLQKDLNELEKVF